MTRRFFALSLSLVLLLAQQLGALHLLSHVLQAPAPVAWVQANSADGADGADSAHGMQADAGDALCQVCLVLATLGVAALPAVWGWLARQARAAAPLPPRRMAPARAAPAPYRARGPPTLPALN